MLRSFRHTISVCCGAYITSSYTSSDSMTLPSYTTEQVQQRDGTDGRPLWVTYRGNVYDVSLFKQQHPGGRYIEQAAGGDVEPFWNIWAYHYLSPKVNQALAETHIGTLKDYKQIDTLPDAYSEEPKRNIDHQVVLIKKPFCSETKPLKLNSYLTDPDSLYVRNHAPVPPGLNIASHAIYFSMGDENNEHEVATLSMKDLESLFQRKSVTSVLQCAGNRAREDARATGANGFTGTPFESISIGLVGNVKWAGVPLTDVLKSLYPVECRSAETSEGCGWHVVFTGADDYETSTPLSHILKTNECLLATHMNGVQLLPDHGYPVRVIIPGVAGARQVKWLQSIRLCNQPSVSPWNSHYYRMCTGSHIQTLPLQSLILSHMDGQLISCNNDSLRVEGVAYTGGLGTKIDRVDLSADNGATWTSAELLWNEIEYDDSSSNYAWVRFTGDISVDVRSRSSKDITLCCRATDSEGRTQPEVSQKHRGYLYNGWHKVDVVLK